MVSRLFHLLLVPVLFSFCVADIFPDASRISRVDYDFIIIGGGTAGNVLANRLTEDPSFKVLVIEDGPSNEGVTDSIVPFFMNNLINSPYDWNFTTVPQRGLNGRSVGYPRGHILGGSSSINGMLYTRGSAEDYDRFARYTGEPGWSWNKILPYIRKNERWTVPVDNHNTTGQFNPSVHGFRGINTVSLPGYQRPAIDSRVSETSQEFPNDFPYNEDTNSGNPLGLGWYQVTIKDGERSSSATSYLAPQFIGRPNLHVALNTRVTRVLSKPGTKLLFNTVEFTKGPTSPRQTLTAKKEVILSAGTFGTPHILLHSGIGDATPLSALGIRSVLHLPSVGKNLSDQPVFGSITAVNSTDPVDTLSPNLTSPSFTNAYKEWNQTRTGPLGVTAWSHVSWSRVPADASIFETTEDPSAGPNTPHLELAIGNSGFGLGLILVAPASRGSVTLKSSDPFDQPFIDPGLLNADFDIFAMRTLVRTAMKFISATAWKGYIINPASLFPVSTPDAMLDEIIRNQSATALHAVGTASMSPKGATYGVVDPDLKLKGASGLRIVDASVMPFVTAGHTQAPTYAIAERAADLIKADWKH